MDIDASQKGTAGSKAVNVFITSGNTSIPFYIPVALQILRCGNLKPTRPHILRNL